MKKRLKHIIVIVVSALTFVAVLPFLVYVPPIQQWLVNEAAKIASSEIGFDISVESVSLKFPLDLSLEGVTVTSGAPRGDTIAVVGRAVVDVELLPLLEERAVVKGLALERVRLNTLDLISDTQVLGSMGQLTVDGSTAHWGTGDVSLGDALLRDADVTVLLSDTAATDTTSSGPTLWRIALSRLTVDNSRVAIHLPGDSLVIGTTLTHAEATHGDIDLADEHYGVGTLIVEQSALTLDHPYEPALPQGMDMNHLALSDIHLAADSIYYRSPVTRLAIRHVSMKERSGMELSDLSGQLTLDATGIRAPSLVLKTPHSAIAAKADIDYGSLDSQGNGQMDVEIDAEVGSHDLLLALQTANPEGERPTLPPWPLTVSAKVSGNMPHAEIDHLVADLPTAFHAEARGYIGFSPDTISHPEWLDRLLADADLKIQLQQVDFALRAAGIDRQTLTLPPGLSVTGTVSAEGRRYTADISAHSGKDGIKAQGHYDKDTDSYQAHIDVDSLDLSHYLPTVACHISGVSATLEGRGTDLFSKKCRMDGNIVAQRLHYDGWDLDNMELIGHLDGGHALVDVMSMNHLAEGTACIDALIDSTHIDATVTTDIGRLNMQALGASDHKLDLGFTADLKISSNLKDSHKLSGLAQNISLRDSAATYHPQNLGVLLNARPDTTYTRIQNGNFIVKLDASGSYDRLFSTLSTLNDTLISLDKRRIIDQPLIKSLLPTGHLYITSGRDNTLANMLKAGQNITFRDLLVDITTSPEHGINGLAHIYGLNADSTLIDTIQVTLKETNHGLSYQARVANNRRNPQMVFTALADGHLYEHGLLLGARIFDKDGKLGLRIGTQAAMEANGVRFTLLPSRPTLGYRDFALNAGNYVFLRNDMRLMANVNLTADDGTGIKVYSEQEDTLQAEASNLQDITISVHRLDLDRLTTSLPFLPKIAGMLNGDFHTVMDRKQQISVAGDMQVASMMFEGSKIGDLGSEFVYLQREDDSHAVDGTLAIDGRQVASLSGSYINKKVTGGHERMDGVLTLEHTPLSLINGFIPDDLLGFEGFTDGELTIAGSTSHPLVDGELLLDSAYLVSQPYGVRLRFDRDPVRIEKSKLLLENFAMYAYNDNALNMQGNLDFSDLGNMTLDVRLQARDFLLINSKQTTGSQVFGKGYVNFFSMMRGPLDHLNFRGRLDVLGSTDLTYLLLDSPLSTDNQLDELVRFTDFSDTTQTVVHRPVPGGLEMNLRINIDQGAHVKCGLNADQTNYVDLFGGGELRMRLGGGEDLQLTGRYTLSSGTMKYSLPVIPLKTFTIHDGSYVEFTGDPTNPTLNITATERTKASVATDDGQSRSVAFDCGVVITKTLADMGLEFTIAAPEDMTVQNELSAMSLEERGKLAVTMLTTGMYLADSNSSNFSMNSALSSFLQSEINQITGNALKTLDLSIGLDNTTDASGQMRTDYSFSFAKRFWNNRLKVQIGGKVSSGQDDLQGQQQSFFDNVTMEYRLSPTSNQYLKLFFKQNVYDWLDGYTGEYGGGYVWKRKMDHWWEMFTGTSGRKNIAPINDNRRQTTDSVGGRRNMPADSVSTNRRQ